MKRQHNFLLIDAHAVIYRAFYAFPKQLTDPQGQMVNAVYGFSRIILTAIRKFEPEYMAIAFDHPKPTFRHKEFDAYKAHRPEMPDELKPQIEIIKKVVEALNIPQYEIEGYEADDLIGTISLQIDQAVAAKNKKANSKPAALKTLLSLLTIIVTGDHDTFQLVDQNTHVWLPGRGKRQQDTEYDAEKVEEKIGLRPEQVIDLKALMGDPSDNIPGIKGVGPKTAVKLIKEFGNIEEIYQFIENMTDYGQVKKAKKAKSDKATPAFLKGSLLKKLKIGKEDAFLSKKLATIDSHVPLKFDLETCRVSSYDKTKAVAIFKKLDFKSLIRLLPDDAFERDLQEALF
ncbi:MAG: 5'-3' exonuclease H3TH domain-containing protein [Candidatus Woesebacteria bacterium]|jgi:DNA polymerase-1